MVELLFISKSSHMKGVYCICHDDYFPYIWYDSRNFFNLNTSEMPTLNQHCTVKSHSIHMDQLTLKHAHQFKNAKNLATSPCFHQFHHSNQHLSNSKQHINISKHIRHFLQASKSLFDCTVQSFPFRKYSSFFIHIIKLIVVALLVNFVKCEGIDQSKLGYNHVTNIDSIGVHDLLQNSFATSYSEGGLYNTNNEVTTHFSNIVPQDSHLLSNVNEFSPTDSMLPEISEIIPFGFSTHKIDTFGYETLNVTVSAPDNSNGEALGVYLLTHYELNRLINYDYHLNDEISIQQKIFGEYIQGGNMSLFMDSYETEVRKRPSKLDYLYTHYSSEDLSNITLLASVYNISQPQLNTLTSNVLNILKDHAEWYRTPVHIAHSQKFIATVSEESLKDYAHVTPFYLLVFNSDTDRHVSNIIVSVHMNPKHTSQVRMYVDVIVSSAFWGSILLGFLFFTTIIMIVTFFMCCQSPGTISRKESEKDVSYFQHLRNDTKLHGMLYFIHCIMYLTDNNFITSICFRSKRARNNEPFNSVTRLFVSLTIFCICTASLLGFQLLHYTIVPSDCMKSYKCENNMCNFFDQKLHSFELDLSVDQREKLRSLYGCGSIEDSIMFLGKSYSPSHLFTLTSHVYIPKESILNDTLYNLTTPFWSDFVVDPFRMDCLQSFCVEECSFNLPFSITSDSAVRDERDQCTSTSNPIRTRSRICRTEVASCNAYDRFFMSLPWLAIISFVLCVFSFLLKTLLYLILKKVFLIYKPKYGKMATAVISCFLAVLSSAFLLLETTLFLALSPGNPHFVTFIQVIFAFSIAFISMFATGSILMIVYYVFALKWRKVYVEMRKELFYSRDKERSNIEHLDDFNFSFGLCIDYIDCNGRVILYIEETTIEPTPTISFKTWIDTQGTKDYKKKRKNGVDKIFVQSSSQKYRLK